jgi:hypothetical protein
MITIILLLVMLTCVFFGFRQKGEVLVIPVATLFAFTQLRGSMPGAPAGFGELSFFHKFGHYLCFLDVQATCLVSSLMFSLPWRH